MATAVAPSDPIRVDESYSLTEFKRRTGMSKYSVRRARAQGLAVKRIGNRAFVTGADWLRFLAERPNEVR